MNILEALRDENLFAPHMGSLDSWAPWETFLASAFALPLPDADLFTQCTGRAASPAKPVKEAWMVVGRRGGKSRITALIATFLACFHDYGAHLSPGEIGLVTVLATDRMQARVIMRYIQSFIKDTPLLATMVVKTSAESIELDNCITIQVTSCTIRAPRGYTVVAALCDEIAFWRSDDTANPDTEILTSLRPAMSTIPNAMLICLSSPYARRGAMWDAHRKFYGHDSGDVLVWQAPTWVMNPTISQSFLHREKERDPLAFQSEYAAQFRSDISAALDTDWIDAALCLKNLDVPRSHNPRPYVGFADMSGARSDSATLAIAHCEPNQPCVMVDLLRRWSPPFSPESVVKEMAETLAKYGLYSVTGDNYSAELTVELFSKAGVDYRSSDDSASNLYLQAVPLFTTGILRAPDHPVLRAELTALERRTRASGRDLITHPPGGHDDLANAACGAAVGARRAASEASDDSQLFPRKWIEEAQARWQPEPRFYAPVCSLGIARTQNQTIVATRRDGWYAELITGAVKAAPDIAGFVVSKRRDNAIVVVDVETGIGVDIFGHLKTNGIEVKGFRGQVESWRKTAEKQLPFKDRLAEACWRFREALNPEQPGGSPIELPNDPELVADLAAFGFKVTAKGIEAKQNRPAPRAESVLLAWAYGPTAKTHLSEWRPDQRVGFMAPKKQVNVNFGRRNRRAMRPSRH